MFIVLLLNLIYKEVVTMRKHCDLKEFGPTTPSPVSLHVIILNWI